MTCPLCVVDAVHPDPIAYRAAALTWPFQSVPLGPDVFHGIAVAADPWLPLWMMHRWPGLTPTLSFVRQSPAGQSEPNYIHTDRGMGDWTALLYLTLDPPPDDGTTFWRHRGRQAIASADIEDPATWADPAQWEPWHHVAARCNRLLVFPAPYYHSRSIRENYGTGADARLVQIVFGTGTLPETEGPWR